MCIIIYFMEENVWSVWYNDISYLAYVIHHCSSHIKTHTSVWNEYIYPKHIMTIKVCHIYMFVCESETLARWFVITISIVTTNVFAYCLGLWWKQTMHDEELRENRNTECVYWVPLNAWIIHVLFCDINVTFGLYVWKKPSCALNMM